MSLKILAIDPGNNFSGWVVIDADDYRPIEFAKSENIGLLHTLRYDRADYDLAVIEMVASYGMAVGAEVFATCVWVGRFQQLLTDEGLDPMLTFRREVKLHHCGSSRAKDANITAALVDRFAAGAKNLGKGTKAHPGWFFGFHADIWAAYALAVQYADGLPGSSGPPGSLPTATAETMRISGSDLRKQLEDDCRQRKNVTVGHQEGVRR